MYTLLRRSCASNPLKLTPSTTFSRSLSLSTPALTSSLSERLQQRRTANASSAETASNTPLHQSTSIKTPQSAQVNVPTDLLNLTQRAIEADPKEAGRLRRRRREEQQRAVRLKRERKENAKRVIELKRNAAKAEDGGETVQKQNVTEQSDGKAEESGENLATDLLRRRMGFSNPGKSERDHKRDLRMSRVAAGGELTDGEQEKLKVLQENLRLLKRQRARMVPWTSLSPKRRKMQVFFLECRLKRDEDRARKKAEKIQLNRTSTPVSTPSPSLSPGLPPPSASSDDSFSPLAPTPSSPSSDSLPIINHANISPYSPPNSPAPIIPSASQLVSSADASPPPLSKAKQAALDWKLKLDAAEKVWKTRRRTVDQDVRALEDKIAGYFPQKPAAEDEIGPRQLRPKKRRAPPLMEKLAVRVVGEEEGKEKGKGKGKGKEKEVSRSEGSEEAANMLMRAMQNLNGPVEAEVSEPATEQSKKGETRRGRITPRMEREERLRIARSRPYHDHPALQPSSSTHQPPSAPPPPELSSYPNKISSTSVEFSPTPSPLPPVPIAKLSHSLDRTLFNPGVHFLRDPRSGVYNFSPEILENVPKLSEFEFGKLPQYVTSSKDEVLKEVTKREGKGFSGSTSSTVGMLCQIYFWLSKGKEVNTSMLSEPWAEKDRSFSMGQRIPVSVILNYNKEDGTYSIDADKSFDATSESNILADYGHLMEKLLTTDPKEFKRFLVDAEDPAPSEADHRQAYHYAKTGNMVLRSQLDAVHDYLPGNGTFDLKTRGTVAIRQDRLNYEESAGYKIDRLRGPWESFEREYYDLIRSAFLKYQFQARIGCMDGIFVAYHSTARFYGFQYLPISEMDEALFGNHETGKQVFKLAVGMLEKLLQEAAGCFEGENVNVTFAAEPQLDMMRLFVTPHQPEEKKEKTDEGVMEKKLPMTLLEVKGTNYLDGEAMIDPVVVEASDSGEVPVWQVGYDIKKWTGEEETAFAADPPTIDAQEINELFYQVRDTQKMFSSLMLPTGVTAKDVKAAAERAKQSGIDLDPSDLSIRFPLHEGVTYRGPSNQAKDLRKLSRKGKERTLLEEEERKGDKTIVVQSSFHVLE